MARRIRAVRSTGGWAIRAAAGRATRSSSTSSHFNDQTWFDHAGNFHSDALHVVERYTPAGPDHIDYEVTIEDPKVFTRPWTMRMVFYRRKEPNLRLLEYDPGRLMDEAQAEQDRRKEN